MLCLNASFECLICYTFAKVSSPDLDFILRWPWGLASANWAMLVHSLDTSVFDLAALMIVYWATLSFSIFSSSPFPIFGGSRLGASWVVLFREWQTLGWYRPISGHAGIMLLQTSTTDTYLTCPCGCPQKVQSCNFASSILLPAAILHTHCKDWLHPKTPILRW